MQEAIGHSLGGFTLVFLIGNGISRRSVAYPLET
jgi:hypothetical protein